MVVHQQFRAVPGKQTISRLLFFCSFNLPGMECRATDLMVHAARPQERGRFPLHVTCHALSYLRCILHMDLI